MAEDWFEALDKELDKKARQITKDMGEQNTIKSDINKTLIEDFWKIWIRFQQKLNVHLSMEPNHSKFAQFTEFPDQWKFKPNLDFSGVNNVQLIDRTQEDGRVGDSLKAWYYVIDGETHLRLVFEFCEGEHYYKYSGWKRIFAEHVLYDDASIKLT